MRHILPVVLLFCLREVTAQHLVGPDAPDLQISYQNQAFTISLVNPISSNNFNENYAEVDPWINDTAPNNLFVFQGYLLYQTQGNTVNVDDRHDASKARLVAQADIADGIGSLTNYEYDQASGSCVPVLQVAGADSGLPQSYLISQDAFTGNALVSGQEYCFVAYAYAHNDKKDSCGQPFPFLIGKRSASGSVTPQCVLASELTNSLSDVLEESSTIKMRYDANAKALHIDPIKESCVLEIYSLTGRLVEVEQLKNGKNHVQVDRLNNGVYVTVIRDRGAIRLRSGFLVAH